MRSFLSTDSANRVRELVDTKKYSVKGSSGARQCADIPWIGIFDRDITDSATHGIYICYLFRTDMTGVYLTLLNQGWTYYRDNFKPGIRAGKEIPSVAFTWREVLEPQERGFSTEDLDLHHDGDLALEYVERVQTSRISPNLPQPKPNKNGRGGKTWSRDPRIAKGALERANFPCEVDRNHVTFVSKASGKPYMEAHHLIPMEYQDDFDHGLDVTSNIVALYPTCHRLIHHATDESKHEIVDKLFSVRSGGLCEQALWCNFLSVKQGVFLKRPIVTILV